MDTVATAVRTPMTARQLDLAVIVPTLNEVGNIAAMIEALDRALCGRAYEIIFVDDWSSDGTPDRVAELARGRTDIRLIRRHGRRGLTSAVLEGALATLAPMIAVIDADMQHDEALLPQLADAVASGAADVAIGSRYVPHGSTGAWDRNRREASRFATRLARRMLGIDVTDPMSGFFVVRADAIHAALPHMSNLGFKVLADLLASSPRPLRTIELPYTFRDRAAGISKLDNAVALEFALMLLDKTVGRWLPPRLILFGAVGGFGLFVHLAILRLTLAFGSGFGAAQTAAVIGAMTFNFTLNNVLTYRDRQLRGWAWVTGLLSFFAVCGLGAIANVGVGSFVFDRDYSWWVAGIAGAIVGSVWNFAASSVLTWRKR
ncbi:MAG: glycosyltransferase [Sphingomonadaceae bacterium]